MSDIITTRITIDSKKISGKIENLVDDKLMLEVHNLFAKMCEPYVPFDTGLLSESGISDVTAQRVRYKDPYAHYMYMGELYLTEDGRAFANFGEKKVPTGIPLNYSTEIHERATSFWDKVMMSEQGESFIKQVKELMIRRSKELYG